VRNKTIENRGDGKVWNQVDGFTEAHSCTPYDGGGYYLRQMGLLLSKRELEVPVTNLNS
jgi:hypothetical protein